MSAPKRAPQLNALGLPQRRDGALDQGPVRDQDAVRPADERRVEETQLSHDTLGPARQDTTLQANALADAKRPIGDQDDAGEQIAENLLGGETDDHSRESTPHREGTAIQPGDPQGDEQHHDDREQPYEEPDRAAVPGSRRR